MRWRRVIPGGSITWDLIEVEAYNIDNWGRALAWCDGHLMTVPYRRGMELVLEGENCVKHFAADGGRWYPELFVGARMTDRSAGWAFAA